MNEKQQAREIIAELEKGNLSVDCPCCGERLPLRDAGLFYLNDFTPAGEEIYRRKLAEIKERRKELRAMRGKISIKSETGGKAVNLGFILERLAPALKTFSFDRNDCRSLFEPIDYVIFEGLSKLGKVTRLIFSDIKTGNARLNTNQKQIRELVGRKKLDWDTYRAEVQ